MGDETGHHTLQRIAQGWKCAGKTHSVVHPRGNETVRELVAAQYPQPGPPRRGGQRKEGDDQR